MTALTLAAADHPPREPVIARRMPAEAGLMVFSESIDGEDGEQVVAVSWSHWMPQHLDLDDGPGSIAWSLNTPGGAVPLHPEFDGVWLTYWTPQLIPLAESVLPIGQPLVPPRSVVGKRWAHVVYTAWQLMTQSGSAQLSELEELSRSGTGAKGINAQVSSMQVLSGWFVSMPATGTLLRANARRHSGVAGGRSALIGATPASTPGFTPTAAANTRSGSCPPTSRARPTSRSRLARESTSGTSRRPLILDQISVRSLPLGAHMGDHIGDQLGLLLERHPLRRM